MKEFAEALICKSKSNRIPDVHNFFGPLIGEWDFEWIDNHKTEKERHIKGEWIFSWVFSDITDSSFHWQHIRAQDGTTWKVHGELFALRKNQ